MNTYLDAATCVFGRTSIAVLVKHDAVEYVRSIIGELTAEM